ncbi:D-sedoheptulose 7-phosphate isomerase [Candidatus Saganbacteria bacterium]|uniref:Phosphoheptose isomerase n=1 Tax=Candidatus Saganbacteria bacterium TaxID=2575572 RepID=A0A9D6UML6_UNCSA|nr:D-sedoheptulose 7-phosphate isomerase [Candidatus Saganbacteria bacterium]
MQEIIRAELKESIEIKNIVSGSLVPAIEKAARTMIEALKAGNKIMFFGNGGSAADAQHLAAEFIGRYRRERKSLPAIALSTDTSILTSLANDYRYEIVFSRQVEGLGRAGDIAFGISTSGNSHNVLEGLLQARKIGCKTIGLLGCGGGKIAEMAYLAIVVPSRNTPRIQECHITIGHILCSLIEKELFEA